MEASRNDHLYHEDSVDEETHDSALNGSALASFLPVMCIPSLRPACDSSEGRLARSTNVHSNLIR
jgi:hypothetical protein